MDDQVRLVVRAGEEYLLVETASKSLTLPSSTLFKNEDFSDAALRLLEKVSTSSSCMVEWVVVTDGLSQRLNS